MFYLIYYFVHLKISSALFVGELQVEESDKDEKEEYYMMWKEHGLAEQLREYSNQNTVTESIITGKLYSLCIRTLNSLLLCMHVG